jgi:cation diffusion facilitator CzcD-associated flavoprotein CzcO
VSGFVVSPRLLTAAEMIARAQLRRHIADPELRAKLTPGYTIGCKRILISNDYLPTHRGTTIAGFPNLFMLIGPNTGLGHTSLIYMIESQVAYVLDALRYLHRSGAAAVEVRPEAQRYNQTFQRQMRGTVWTTGGCASWYLDAHGRNTTLWPTFTWRFRRATRAFRPAEYVIPTPSTHAIVASCGSLPA